MAESTYYVVTESQGPNWNPVRARREQDKWDEHASFMDGLVEDGFVVLGGPLGDGDEVLLVVRAGAEAEIEARLAADPWLPMEILRIAKIEPWEILLGDPSRT
ncbi:MAG: uncharacterized protein QOD08_406 [Gaiellaceae bacterium]|jgi:uncharacterized protein YciI|nr:uncharacterized protein [Gaiellaceae bacterium]MDX6483675.1 uncharacterized protein [Gaiellaceae bacterium]MDX6518248.1 uncharacterized protein [Gaiellaceae bacterium]